MTSAESELDQSQSTTQTTWRRKLLSYLWMMGALYMGICLLLMMFQRSMIYLPAKSKEISPLEAGLSYESVEAISFTSVSTRVEVQGWFAQTEPSAPSTKWATIIFCGNGYHRGGRGDVITLLNQLGSDVFIFDYQGYGETAGSPNEENIISDAKQIWSMATDKYGYESQHILIFGESLGGGVATQLAEYACQQQEIPAALVLRSTFSSLVDAASNHYQWLPVKLLLFDRYRSDHSITNVNCPVLQFHGDQDQIVPASSGRKLFKQAPDSSFVGIKKQFILLEGVGHNNVPQHLHSELGQELQTFVDRIGL